MLTDVELAADLLEENLREKIVPFKAEDIETVKKLESKNGMLFDLILKFFCLVRKFGNKALKVQTMFSISKLTVGHLFYDLL